jgi:hypothetical protein
MTSNRGICDADGLIDHLGTDPVATDHGDAQS